MEEVLENLIIDLCSEEQPCLDVNSFFASI